LVEAVRLEGDCALGLLRAEGKLLMGPDLASRVELGAGDRLVVLAEN
jgi:hypothetical protein